MFVVKVLSVEMGLQCLLEGGDTRTVSDKKKRWQNKDPSANNDIYNDVHIIEL